MIIDADDDDDNEDDSDDDDDDDDDIIITVMEIKIIWKDYPSVINIMKCITQSDCWKFSRKIFTVKSLGNKFYEQRAIYFLQKVHKSKWI